MHNYFDLIASLTIMALALSLAVPSVLESSIQVVEVQNVESQPGDTRAMMLLNDPGEPADWGLSINAPARVGLSSSGALTPSTLDPLKVARLDPANKYYTRYSLNDARYQQGYHESIATDTQDFVDSNTSDVDSSADKGTHSNFANQQAGPDSVYDTLTEATISNEDWRFAVSEGESTWSADTNYQTKVTLTFTPPTQAYYLVIATAEIGGSSTSYNIKARLNIDGSYYGESVDRPFNTADYFTWSGIKILELTATSHTVRIEYATGTAGYAVKIRNARIIAMQVDKGGTPFYQLTEPSDSSTSATSYTDIATLTWTPTSAGYWLILSVGYVRCTSTSYQNYANLVVNGTQYAEDSWRPFSTSSSIRHCFSSHKIVYLDTASNTLKIQMYTTGSTLYYYGVKLYAVDLTGLGATYDYAVSEAQSSWNTNTNWQDKVTVNFNSPADNTPYLIIASGTIWESSTSYQAKAQVIVDGVTVVGQQLKYPRNTADRVNFMVGKEYNFTQGSHNVKIQYATSSISGTVYIRNARVTVIKLPLYTATNNYELDLEVQWTSVDYDEAYELLCIYTGNLGGEPLRVDYWTGSSWSNLITGLTPNGWNNVSVPLTSSTFTIRFKGGTETGDPAQNSWQVDAVLLHSWTVPNVKGKLGIPDDEGFYLTIKPVYDVSVDFTNRTTIPYNPSNYSLLSSTQLVSGSASSLNSSDDAYMTLRSYYTDDTGTNVEDYVDNNTCDVDSSPDRGTHGNFLGEQAGPDSSYDTLTEGRSSTWYNDTAPASVTIWTSPDLSGSASTYTTYGVGNLGSDDGSYGGVDIQDAGVVNQDQQYAAIFDYNLSSLGVTGSDIQALKFEAELYLIGGTGRAPTNDPFEFSNMDNDGVFIWNWQLSSWQQMGTDFIDASQWTYLDNPLAASWDNLNEQSQENPLIRIKSSGWSNAYMNSTGFVRIRVWLQGEFEGSTYDGCMVFDYARVDVQYLIPNYQLDLEVQWTGVDYVEDNEELCIYAGSTGAEDVGVDYWTGSSWSNLFTDLTPNSWNNISVSLTSSTFTVRFKGGSEAGDTTQDTWQIDAALLHVRTTRAPGYKLEAEFSGSSNLATWSQLNWTVESAWNTSSVTVKLQLYDYQVNSYPPTDGDGYISYVSSAIPNIDENKTQTITLNPTRFKDASGSWKVRLTAVKEGGSPFDCRIDWMEFKVATGLAAVQVTRGSIPVPDARVDLFMVASTPGDSMTGTTDSRGEVEIPISPAQENSDVGAVVAFACKDGLTGFGWDTFLGGSYWWGPVCDVLTETAPAPWWDSNYGYRKQLTVTNNNPSDTLQSGYSVSFTVDTTGPKFLDNGDDVRIVYWNGTNNVELDRVNETAFNDANTNIWFKTQASIPASSSDSSYYMYYGNPAAGSPPTNKNNVYVFWDDFETGSLNKWTVDTGFTVATDQARSGTYSMKRGPVTATTLFAVANGVNEANVLFESYWRISYTGPDISQILRKQTGQNNYETNLEGTTGWDIAKLIGGSWTELAANQGTPQENVWVKTTTIIYGTNMRVLKDDVQITPPTGWTNVGTELNSGSIGFRTWDISSGQNWWMDDVKVRKYVSPEPSTTVGLEELMAPEVSYVLDLEVQFTGVDYSQANEELCIYTGNLPSENLLVDYWNGSSWINLFTTMAPYSWNNISVPLTSSTFTIRFRDSSPTGDINQDSWNIDAVLLHVWTPGGANIQDYVDNNTSDVDSSPDRGTHSNFENEKSAEIGLTQPIPGKCFVASSNLYLYTDTSVPGFTVSKVTFHVVTPQGLLQPKTLDYGTPGTGEKLHSVDFSEWNAVPTPAVIWVYVETVRSGNDWYTYAIQGYPVNGQISYGLYPKAVTRTETFQTYVTIQGVVYEATYVYWKGYREA